MSQKSVQQIKGMFNGPKKVSIGTKDVQWAKGVRVHWDKGLFNGPRWCPMSQKSVYRDERLANEGFRQEEGVLNEPKVYSMNSMGHRGVHWDNEGLNGPKVCSVFTL